MAGNIIPAIATTNAITAGIVVMRVFRVLMDEYEKCQSVYVRLRPNARNQFMVPDKCKLYQLYVTKIYNIFVFLVSFGTTKS